MQKDQDILDRLEIINHNLSSLPVAQIVQVLEILSGTTNGAHQHSAQELSKLTLAVNQLSQEVKSIKQSVGLVSRHIPVPKGRRIRCFFMVHHMASWNVFSTIFAAMEKADDFDPIVATISHKDERYEKNGRFSTSEEEAHHELTRLAIPHVRLSTEDSYQGLDIIKAIAPDLLFRQVPYDDLYSPGYKTAELTFTRLCYVNYSFAMPKKFAPGHAAVPAGFAAPYHADEYFHRMCWRIFCESDIHRDMYARASSRGGDNLVSVGYSKFDSLLESARDNPPLWPVKNEDGKKRFRIIWAPHGSVTQQCLGFGMFLDIYKDMLAWAGERPDMDFVLRPHPMAFGLFVSTGLMSQGEMDGFLSAWDALPNTARYDGSEYARLFAASDVLVTDGVGFFAEYQLFLKPLIYMDSQRHTGFNEAGEIVIESANRVTNVVGARALCDRLQKGEPDPMREMQKKNLPRYFSYPGQSGLRILDAIRAGLARERGESVSDKKLLPSGS